MSGFVCFCIVVCLLRCFLLDCERNPGWGDYGCFHPALVMTEGSIACLVLLKLFCVYASGPCAEQRVEQNRQLGTSDMLEPVEARRPHRKKRIEARGKKCYSHGRFNKIMC